MKLDHFALYVEDLEGMKSFYEKYFKAGANELYYNPETGLKTYFLTFDGGGRLELMARPDVVPVGKEMPSMGYAHLAVGAGGRDEVERVFEIRRRSGEGYDGKVVKHVW